MDSISHLLLGASIGGALAPPKARRRAMWLGAALNTLPDLDYLVIGWGDAVTRFTAHRSFSHSLFVLPFVVLLIWRLWLRWYPPAKADSRRWLSLIAVGLISHPLADALTVYGTQLFWPLATPPVMLASIFIIDPLYTLPLAVGVVAATVLRRMGRGDGVAAGRWLAAGLALSVAYQAWGLAAKFHVDALAKTQVASEGAEDARTLVMPTAFNSLLWRVLVIDGDGYREGYYSLLSGETHVAWRPRLPREVAVDASLPGYARLDWFTDGYNRVQPYCNDSGCLLVFTDLRMGMEPEYIFNFGLAHKRGQGLFVPLSGEKPGDDDWVPYQDAQSLDWRTLGAVPLTWVWRRIWDADVAPERHG